MMTQAERRPQDGGEPRAATIRGLLAEAAMRSTDAMAILAPGRPALSYRRLLEQVQEVGEALGGLGVGRGDRVALVLPNGPEMAVAFLGVAVAATCAPLNPAYRASEFDFYLPGPPAGAPHTNGGWMRYDLHGYSAASPEISFLSRLGARSPSVLLRSLLLLRYLLLRGLLRRLLLGRHVGSHLLSSAASGSRWSSSTSNIKERSGESR
jgi:hypothetical protein